MADVLTWKCGGCNTVLKLRHGCQRCADAARARLHAEGVCRDEMIVRKGKDAARFVRDMPRDEPDSYVVSLADRYEGVIEAAVAQLKYDKELDDMYAFAEELEDQLQQAKVANQRSVIDAALADVAELKTAQHEPPPVGAEVSYEVALADMQRRSEARYSIPIYEAQYRWNGILVWDNPRYDRHGVTSTMSHDELREYGWTRLPDAETPTTGATDETLRSMAAQGVRYSPPVGAEVPWEVAKRDMMLRSEARYNHRILGMASSGHEYAWSHGELVHRVQGQSWQSSCYLEHECADPQRRWVRLA